MGQNNLMNISFVNALPNHMNIENAVGACDIQYSSLSYNCQPTITQMYTLPMSALTNFYEMCCKKDPASFFDQLFGHC